MSGDPREVAARDAARAAVRSAGARAQAGSGRGSPLTAARARNDALRAWAAASVLHGVPVAYPEALQ